MPRTVQVEVGREQLSGDPETHEPDIYQYDLYLGPALPEAAVIPLGRIMGVTIRALNF